GEEARRAAPKAEGAAHPGLPHGAGESVALQRPLEGDVAGKDEADARTAQRHGNARQRRVAAAERDERGLPVQLDGDVDGLAARREGIRPRPAAGKGGGGGERGGHRGPRRSARATPSAQASSCSARSIACTSTCRWNQSWPRFEFVGSIRRYPASRSSVSATNCSTCASSTSGVVRPP